MYLYLFHHPQSHRVYQTEEFSSMPWYRHEARWLADTLWGWALSITYHPHVCASVLTAKTHTLSWLLQFASVPCHNPTAICVCLVHINKAIVVRRTFMFIYLLETPLPCVPAIWMCRVSLALCRRNRLANLTEIRCSGIAHFHREHAVICSYMTNIYIFARLCGVCAMVVAVEILVAPWSCGLWI